MKIKELVKSDKGVTVVIFALMIMVIMGCCALAVDIGRVAIEKSRLQNAVDAASLAAAQDMPDTATAANTAKQYMQLNGYAPSDISITYSNSNTVIKIIGTKIIDYTFARILGINDATITTNAAAKSGISREPFDYAVFAGGGPASFNGSKHVFDGSVYGRDGVSLGNKAEILHGNAVSSNSTCGPSGTTFGNGSIITNNPVIPMPDFSELIKAQGIICTNEADFNARFGGKTVDGPIYVNGDLTINGRIKGKGIIYASGTITYTAAQDPTDSICLYAGGTGGMTFNGGTGMVYGIMYAPNGTIRVNGGPNGVVYGRIVAKTVDVNGAKFSVYSSLHDLGGLDSIKGVSLIE